MRKKKSWTCLMSLVLSATIMIPAQAAYATGVERQAEEAGMEAYAESRAADEDGFEIEDGVLKKYTGTATEVVIPEEVTSIGYGAFLGCSSLKEITIPKGVTSIGIEAFCGCSGLENIRVEEGNTVYDSRENCNAVIETGSNTLIRGCKNTIIPEGVTAIGEQAFCRCSSLTEIVIPEGVVSIGNAAFYECTNLEEINIPEGVAVLEANTFNGCESLKKIALPEGVKSIQGFSFQRCFSLEEINIPASVEEIGPAFDACRSLSNITIPRGVASIASGAFSGCSSLEYIKVEEGNAVYDSRENCNAIIEKESGILLAGGKNTVIPEGVTSIGRSAFLGSGLSKISIPKGVTMIERSAFQNCSSLTEISISESVTEIQSYAFQGCSSLMEIVVPESVTAIEEYVFSGCSSLKRISIPESVTSIESNAFAGCNAGLIIYGKTGSYVEVYAKENNIKFSSTGMALNPIGKKTISSNNVSLSQNSYTYDGKAKKPTVTVKDGSKTLVQNTDYIVSYSKNINAGTAKVKITGKGNYEGTVTKNFTITVKKGTSHKVGSYQYKVTGTSTVSMVGVKDNKITKVKVPKTAKIGGKSFKVTAIGSSAFKNNKKITSIEIGDNVKIIGASAFEGCTKLGKATIGKGVTEIGGNAFKNCKKLGTITIKSTKLKKVGRNALKGIKPTLKIKVPAKKLPAYKRLFKNKGQGRKVKIVK